MVEQDGDVGGEALKLADPVGQGGQGTDDEEGAGEAVFVEMSQESDSLDGFAQACVGVCVS